MILKRIQIKNIRSYENSEIIFPEGSILLSGDIGTGKTSILMSIEFGLFGLQPGQKGSSILRNGFDSGGVILEFEIDEKKIVVERTLKKSSKSITQDYCSIEIDGEKEELSVTELKSRILELLSYPSEFAKKQNMLYKFTVYTPQEEMKQIMLEDADMRINTLRHVFGIDKYKKVIENCSIVLAKIREEKRFKEGLIENLENDKSTLVKKETEIQEKEKETFILEKNVALKKIEVEKIKNEQQEINQKILEKNRIEQEIEKTKLMIATKKDLMESNKRVLEQLKNSLEELNSLDFDERKISELETEIKELRIKKEILTEEFLKASSQINTFVAKNSENQNLILRIGKLEMCPTCLQDVNPVHKSNVLNKVEGDVAENAKKIKEFSIIKDEVSKNIAQLSSKIFEREREVQELKIKKIKLESKKEKIERIEDIEKNQNFLNKDLELLGGQIELLRNSSQELIKFELIFERKKKELEIAFREERIEEIKLAETKKEIEGINYQIKEILDKIVHAEEAKTSLSYLIKLEDWMQKKFIPVTSQIEKNVMAKLKQEFSQLLSEWFLMLVPEVFNIRLDENFTPIIEQYDYEIDYAHLSGGERTAIALAYRLALNQVINSLISKIKTRNLIILDEPTDGFSEQQLDKLRDVLDELNAKQLIIVSHEPKIESFVENVIKLKKEEGKSSVT